MRNMTLQNIAAACSGIYVGRESDKQKEAAGVVLDSRKLEPGYAFIAVKGERVDGHDYIGDVIAKGAACIICEKMPEHAEGNFIQVKDSFQALKDIAEFYRKQMDLPVVGITGSVGKTSTKEFIAGVLSKKYNVLKTEGNFNNEVGVPLTVLRIRDEHEIAVLEMGINHFGEMRRLSRMARPDVCVFTNIGDCHLEYLNSREGVLQAKTEIFDYMNEDGCVFLNGDDDMLRTVEKVKHKKPVTFGLTGQSDIHADEIVNKGLLGSEALIRTPQGEMQVQIRLPGEHMVRNALAAASVGLYFGLSQEEITEGISSILPVGGRSNIIRKDSLILIDDCYNANPVSMRAALDLLASSEGKTIAVLGDMYELGNTEEQMHTQIGEYAVSKGITSLICVGDLSRFMYQGACRAKKKNFSNTGVFYFENKVKLFEKMKEFIRPEEEAAVLIKASNGMGFSEVVDRILHS